MQALKVGRYAPTRRCSPRVLCNHPRSDRPAVQRWSCLREVPGSSPKILCRLRIGSRRTAVPHCSATPDGRSDTVTTFTTLAAFPAAEQNTTTYRGRTITRIAVAIATIWTVHDDVDVTRARSCPVHAHGVLSLSDGCLGSERSVAPTDGHSENPVPERTPKLSSSSPQARAQPATRGAFLLQRASPSGTRGTSPPASHRSRC
jgi:hypothetical protein